MWGEWSPLERLIWLYIVLGGGGGTSTTVTGASPLALVNALAKPIKKLIQYGKCTTVNSETYCNNGKLVAVDDELPVEYKRQIGFKFSASTYYRIPDFHLRGTDTVRISFSADKACNVFGCYTDTSAEDNYSLYASTSSGGKYLRYDGDTYSSYIPSSQVGERLDVVITPTGTSGMPTDSVITPAEFEATADLCIGTTSTSASSSKLDGNIWGNFVVDGRLTLIPCKRLSDDALGYYDLDSDTFYEPVGSAPTSLGVDTLHLTALSVEGTPEVLMVTGEESESLSGDIVSFEVNKPSVVSALNVNVEPIQDLHGYDSPWPAGGGKNKLNSGFCLNRTSRGLRTVVNADGSITLTGTAETATRYWNSADNLGLTLAAGTYTLSPSNLRLEKSGGSVYGTFTLSEETAFSNVYWSGFTSGEVVNTIVYPQLEIGSTATAYAPYENICPISGRTSVTVTRTGVNIWDEEWEVGGINSSTGQNNNETNLIRSKNYIPVKPGMAIWVQSPNQGTTQGNLRSRYYDINKQYLGMNPTMNVRATIASIEIPDNCYFARFACQPYYGTSYNNDISINYPSTDRNYHPYQGNTYTIQLGDTVYGGTLDVTAGKLTATMAMVDLGTLTWYVPSDSYRFRAVLQNPKQVSAGSIKGNMLCSSYATLTANQTYLKVEGISLQQNTNDIYVYDAQKESMTVAAFKAAMSGVQLCYELATPIEITLTPTQIETLIGTNNIWADTGSIESLKYKAMQTASVENLFAVDDIADEQNIISGTVTRRCEAVVSDGTTPSGRYIGEVGDGNIIVKVRETGYEGDVATFEADRVTPLNGLTVNVEPIQDLHGYDNPWPDGGGINLVDKFSNESYGGTVSTDGLTATSKVVTASGNSNFMRAVFSKPFDAVTSETFYVSVDVRLLAGTMDSFAFQLVGGSNLTSIGICKYANVPSTAKQRISFSGSPNRDDQVRGIYVQAKNADAAQLEISNIQISKIENYNYHSYSNICPISGRTSATVTRTGKNLLNPNDCVDDLYIAVSSMIFQRISGASVYYAFVKPNTTYSLSAEKGDRTVICSCNAIPANNGAIKRVIVNKSTFNLPATFTTSADETIIAIYVNRNAEAKPTQIQLELGSTASAYEPYTANTYTIQLGDTVYGGTLDVTGGKMVVDMAMVDLGTLTWSRGGTNTAGIYRFSSNIPTVIAESGSAIPRMLCSQYATVSPNKTYQRVNGVSNNLNIAQVMVFDDAYSNGDVAAFKTAMSGVQLVYELATPTEITLTPTQIETLLGQNNIWSDAGSVKAYVADAELIEHVTAQPMRTAEGSNTVSVTSAVDPVQLEVEYVKAED